MLYLKLYFRQKWREYHESDRRVCKKHSGFSGTGNYIQRCNKHSSGCRGLHLAIDLMQEKLKDVEFDVVVGPESRGFILEFQLRITCISHLSRSEKKESSLARLFLLNMNWNMVLLRSRCIKMRSNRDKEWLSLTI